MASVLSCVRTFQVRWLTLRVQVPNNHILTLNLYYNHYYPNPKHLIIGYMDPLAKSLHKVAAVTHQGMQVHLSSSWRF